MENKTHYKDFFKSNVLTDGDFNYDQDTVATIVQVADVELETRDGKQMTTCLILDGYGKPMKAPNVVLKNCKTALRSPYIEDWVGKQVSIYVEKGLKAFGGVHDVLRVRPYAPRVQVDLNPAKAQLNACKSVDELYKVHGSLEQSIQQNPQILGLCGQIKQNLEK